ncbi:Pvc16 family protein [Streptomyces sp. NPDC056519]|uniref:Pvc16 family protein n=1 Tax=Streptomyces sp. NPDC056519 TaxID=3345849 RepID=UPI003696763D
MLHATSAALRGHLQTALAGRCTVTAGPPSGPPNGAPEGTGVPRGLGVHFVHVAAVDRGLAVDSVQVRDGRGRVVGRRSPVRRYRTRWLVWSWAPTEGERLELLDDALASLAAEPVLPEGAASPELTAGGPVQVEVAPGTGTAAEIAGVFAGLGVAVRPALEVVLTAGLAPAVEAVPGPPADVRVVSRPHPSRPAVLRPYPRSDPAA